MTPPKFDYILPEISNEALKQTMKKTRKHTTRFSTLNPSPLEPREAKKIYMSELFTCRRAAKQGRVRAAAAATSTVNRIPNTRMTSEANECLNCSPTADGRRRKGLLERFLSLLGWKLSPIYYPESPLVVPKTKQNKRESFQKKILKLPYP